MHQQIAEFTDLFRRQSAELDGTQSWRNLYIKNLEGKSKLLSKAAFIRFRHTY
jgi:hypothetical protein